MATISTNRGVLTDLEFEALATREFVTRHPSRLPAPRQLELLLTRYAIASHEEEWARSVALRALTKLLVGSGAACRA